MPLRIDDTTTLPGGAHLRVRLPHASDRTGLRELLARLGVAADDLELARALRFDPRRRTVACATAWDGTTERLVAWGAIEPGAGAPRTLVADEELAPGAGAVLAAALRKRAAQHAAA